ncbi:cutinase transcription factor 1 beta [Coniochaeta sp. 2T2.1]|nr:cutinase transcription factor 1 beta [Coniochaeta sp. 2T2.1]
MSTSELSAVPTNAANRGIATKDTTEANISSSRGITWPNQSKRCSAADAPPAKVKKRAARACKRCRARKVRCDVTYGTPCGNCRWDKVECIIQQSRRQIQASPFGDLSSSQSPSSLKEPNLYGQLPAFFKPLPTKFAVEEIRYLQSKGALSIPSAPLQNALLQAYVEYVHPYMPLELFPFLNAVNAGDGRAGKVSLLMYQAIMFAATAFVDIEALLEAGYATRKAARKAFFQKTRLLHDFDCESDRLVVVQALLLMTYWYETSDDQKDAWHWIGVAISLAYTMGLHRKLGAMSVSTSRQKLGKRIWWSCFMRDRLIALGMRQPSRIHDEDFDVPMLEEGDFEIEVFPEDNNILPLECTVVRDITMQQVLAALCIAKFQLSICIGHMLNSLYSVNMRDRVHPENTTNSTWMLFPNKKIDYMESFLSIDLELVAWADALPQCCRYTPLMPLDVKSGNSTIAVQRTLLHMLYYTIVLTLHRPQLLQPSPIHALTTPRIVQDISRLYVRDATIYITRMASELHHLRLDRFLPITGVTVILPTMMIQLLEMKNPAPQARDLAARGFQQCMCVMEKLREIYVAADDIITFLDAALRKVGIDINELAAAGVTNQHLKFARARFIGQTPLAEQDIDSANGALTSSAMAKAEKASSPSLISSLGQEAFDWNAVTGTEFDVDQWLQFPPEEARQQ